MRHRFIARIILPGHHSTRYDACSAVASTRVFRSDSVIVWLCGGVTAKSCPLFPHGDVTMRPFLSLSLVVVGLFLTVRLPAADDVQDKAEAALKRYYEDRLKQPFLKNPDEPEAKPEPPPWTAPLRQLASDKPDERRQAAVFLRELVAQAHEHERTGKAPWRSTPYWGGGADIPARTLREEVAKELGAAKALPDALPVIRWYLEKETNPGLLPPIMIALAKLKTREADALRVEVAAKPHDNAVVAAEALKQVALGKQTLPAERLAALCQHHRTEIRDAARKLNTLQGGKDPGVFDAAKAVRSEPLRKLMENVQSLLTELPPAKAEFVEVTVKYLDSDKKVRDTHASRGWLIRQDKDTVEIYTPYGHSQSFRNGEKDKHTLSERIPNGVKYTEIDATTDVAVAPAEIEVLIESVEKARAKDGDPHGLSERGPLTGQFQGSGASLYEAILAAWLVRAERYEEAARVLLPALDTLYEDRHLVEMVRGRMGEIHGYRMLVAFAGDRDYAAVLNEAKLIVEKYPGTRFEAYAKGFAEQLPRRRDDFTKLKLPTAGEWADLKKKLTREQQIDFLCSRLRLLNCFQMGQPGGYDDHAKQYAEPCGLAANASWGLGKGKTEVINPLTELVGERSWTDDEKPRSKGLELTLKDVPYLSKHLRDNWYQPTVSFWRDFHPDRHLSTTRPEVAGIINGLAQRDLCQTRGWSESKPEAIDKEIERINKWAKENANKTSIELTWEELEERIAEGADWSQIDGRVEWLLKKKESKAFDVMKQYLEKEKTDEWSKAKILDSYLEHDVAKAKGLAPKYLDAKDHFVRRSAALIVFRTDDKTKARKILGDELASCDLEGELPLPAVQALLDDGSEESKRQVARLFANQDLAHKRNYTRWNIFKLCVKAGMKEPYEFYLPLLDNNDKELPYLDAKGMRSGASFFDPSVAVETAEEIAKHFASDDRAVQEIVKYNPKTADQIPHLKKWLQKNLPSTEK
jgi:hypothetical protein